MSPTEPRRPAVSVVICAFTEQRWDDLVAAVGSVDAQTHRAEELILVIDHNEVLEARARRAFPEVTVVANAGPRGLSSGRNTATAIAAGDLVAFLDDDATADPQWLETLVEVFDRDEVVAAGGRALPAWDGGRPGWFPPEFDWVVGCTHDGMPLERAEVRNVIGCNMMFRRSALAGTGGFRTSLGRVGSVPLGCEETELCIRLRSERPGSVVVYEPAARIDHHVTPGRRRFRYFVARNRAEGVSKSIVSSMVGADAGMSTERDYVRRVLLAACWRGVRETFTGAPVGLARTGAIVAGLGAFGVGFAQGEVARRTGRSRTVWA